MEGLSGLQNLHVLDVSSNKLTSVDDIEKLTMYWQHIPPLTFIHTLLDFFKIFRVFAEMILFSIWRLDDLWLNDNQIATLDGFGMAVAGSRERLTTIYLERNPCVSFCLVRKTFINLLKKNHLTVSNYVIFAILVHLNVI